jgi:toxin ParE1/3/4
MPYLVHITDRAVADVTDAVNRISQQAPQAAANWHARLLARIQKLEESPHSNPLADEAAEVGIELREMLFGKRSGIWRILFTVQGDSVNVLHIRHAARERLTGEDL